MSKQRRTTAPVLCMFVLAGAATTLSSAVTPARVTQGEDRLFQSFVEDGTIVPNQWWEGRMEVDRNYHDVDMTLLGVVAAFQPVKRLEVGGRVGFGRTRPSVPGSDDSGVTDLDVWGKWLLGTFGNQTDVVVGGLATLPTGDRSAGLGNDSFDLQGFGAVRFRLPRAIVSGHAGVRINGDGHTRGDLPSGDLRIAGRTSTLLGAGVIFPLSDKVSLVGEANVESERFRGFDSDFRVLGGVNWRPLNRGTFRGAVSVGLTRGAPDSQVLVGYAYSF